MKKENDELFDLFRSRLEHAGMPVRNDLWEKLENEIPVVLQSRRRLVMRRFAAAASVLLILGGASAAFWYISPKDEIADAFKEVAVSTGVKGTIERDGVRTELPPLPITSSVANPINRTVGFKNMEEIEDETFSISISVSMSVTERSNTSGNEYNRYAGNQRNTSGFQQETQEETTSFLPVEKEKNRKWAIGLFASGTPAAKRDATQGMQMFSDRSNALNVINKPGAVSKDQFSSEAEYDNYMHLSGLLSGQEQFTRVKHKLPVSVGMSIKRKLSKHLALETGLVYTQLNSELSAGGKDTYYHQDQKLHYIGIPLKAGYTFLDNDHLDMYAVAGGMVEKCVSGKVKTDYYADGQKIHSAKSSIKADPLQFSLVAGLGVQYKFNDRISVYAEPGISYYFDDGSPVSTIRKEKPLNFNLLCGVRMTY